MTAAESAQLTDQILAALPGARAAIARAVGRKPSDGTVRRRLDKLAADGLAAKDGDVWRGCHELPDIDGYAYPDDFDDEARRLVLQTVDRLQTRAGWEDGDVDLVEDYVRAKQRARKANETTELFTLAETGRAFTHPSIAIARQAERDALVYAKELRLTPRARAESDDGADPRDDD